MSATLDPAVPQSYTFDGPSTDSYQYLICPGTTAINLLLSDANLYIGFGIGGLGNPHSAIYPPDDEVYIPVTAALGRKCDVIRFKSYTPGMPADVKMMARP